MDARQAVQRTMDRMIAGYKVRDVEMILSCYTREAAYAAVPGQSTVGWRALRTLFEQIITSDPEFQFQSEEIIVVDDTALHACAYEARMPGDDITHKGLSVAVLQRQPDGEWLIVVDHPSAQRILDQ